MKYRSLAAALAASALLPLSAAHATDLEVTHWWTSGGEAAAVAEFAKAFDATGNHWVDGAIAGLPGRTPAAHRAALGHGFGGDRREPILDRHPLHRGQHGQVPGRHAREDRQGEQPPQPEAP